MARRGAAWMRMQTLVADLAVDRVLSLEQIERHYGLSLDNLRGSGLWCRSGYMRDLAANGSRKASRDVSFVSQENITDHVIPILAHLAGTAETRRRLNASRND